MAYQCDEHPDVQASVIITNLDNGDTAAMCGTVCLPAWAAAMDAALNGMASAEQVAAEAGGTFAAADQLDGGSTVGGDEHGRVSEDNGTPFTPDPDASEAETPASA